MGVRIQTSPLDPWTELAHAGAALTATGACGATAVFVGTMRDFNQGESVRALRLEHYPGMTEKELARIETEACARWQLLDTLIVHRVGEIRPGEPIVLVAVWSAHREQAFAACRYLIEELKTRATFWKQETTTAGTRWVAPVGE